MIPLKQNTARRTSLKCNTHPADPPLQFPAHRPVHWCQAYRGTCTCHRPWKPCHCFCRAGSGRGHSRLCTALWPCGGRASSPRHREPPSPARRSAAAAQSNSRGETVKVRRAVRLYCLIRWHMKLILLVLTCCFMTFGNDRTESAQFEYISQFLAGSSSCMAFSKFICSMPPPSTSTLDTWLVLFPSILKMFGEMTGWFRRFRSLLEALECLQN